MKRLVVCVIAVCLLFAAGCVKDSPVSSIAVDSSDIKYDITMKQDLLCLMAAYSGYITDVERKEDGKVYIAMKSGKRIPYDDKKTKSFEQKLDNPDLQDMMEQLYPLSDIDELIPQDFNPGRIRVYALLKEVYGSSQQQVQANLDNVVAGYRHFQFNRQNNAANAFKTAMGELVSLAQQRKDVVPFLFPLGGTFNYRLIAGTGRLSPHSFGISVDLAVNKKDYWKWVSRDEGQKRLNVYPDEIVKVFEKNNFIWGGKWGYFDFMHFEYRPELILKARYFSGEYENGEAWYGSKPEAYTGAKDYIRLIDKALE